MVVVGGGGWKIIYENLAMNDEEEGDTDIGIQYLPSLPSPHTVVKVEGRKILNWYIWKEQEFRKGRACPTPPKVQ